MANKIEIPNEVASKAQEKWPKLPENVGLPVKQESQTERQELTNDVLKTISNKEFLKLPLEKRLKHITSPKVDYAQVASGNVKEVNITFTFDGKMNRELFMETTAGQILPPEVSEIKIWNELYSRKWLWGELFCWNSRLIIKDWTKIEVSKIRNKQEIAQIEKENEWKYTQFMKSNTWSSQDIVKEAIYRWIDPKFALLFSKDLYAKTSENEKKVVLEDMFTEFVRYRGAFHLTDNLKDGKYDEKLVLWIFAKFNKTNWEEKAKEYWISLSVIDDYKSNWERYISLKADEIDNADNLPEWGYLKWEKLLENKEFSDKLDQVCKNIWAKRDDLIKLMKAESWLDPRIVNWQTKATWLIQFIPSTALDLWTTVWKIRSLKAVEQLDFVQRFFEKNSHGKDLSSLSNLYKVVFYPYSLNKDDNYVFGSHNGMSEKVASQNPAISRFSQRADGYIDWYAFSAYVDNHVSRFSA